MPLYDYVLKCFNAIVVKYVCAARSLAVATSGSIYSLLCFLHDYLSVLQSVSGSYISSPIADVQEQKVAMFELAQTLLHTPAISCLWDEVLQLILCILEIEVESCGTLLLLKMAVMIVVLHMGCF